MANTTPFILTSRDRLYPHDQIVNDYPVKVVSARFDAVALTAYKGSALATEDTTQLITIPAGAFVLNVTHKVVTAQGAAMTYDIGYDGNPDCFVDGADGNAATDAASFNAATSPAANGIGLYFSAANTVDLVFKTGACTIAVIDVSVTYIEVKPLAA